MNRILSLAVAVAAFFVLDIHVGVLRLMAGVALLFLSEYLWSTARASTGARGDLKATAQRHQPPQSARG